MILRGENTMKKKEKNLLVNDALLNEVTEEVKNDQLKLLWDKYGLFIIIFVALSLSVAVSFETFRSWINKRNQEISNAFAFAISLQDQGRLDESLSLLRTIAKSSSLYADIAKLQMANIYMAQNKNTDAIEILNNLATNNANNKQMQEIASIKLAAYKIDSGVSAEEIKNLLYPIVNNEGHNYVVAHELLAMLAIREGNLEEAKREYEHILASENSSDRIKSRAQDMLTTINDKK